MSNIYIPYTYRITSKTTGQHYYGVRYAKGCHPSDLWTSYFTSSKYVKEHIEQYGKEDFIIEIRKKFPNDPKAAQDWEDKVLTRLRVVEKDEWLNRTTNAAPFVYERTAEHRANISKRMKGTVSAFKGKKHTDETKRILSEKAKGRKTGRTADDFTDEWKKNISNSKSGQQNFYHTEEHKKASSKRALGNSYAKGLIWINNGKEGKRVHPEELDNFPGYTRGRLNRKQRHNEES